MRKIKFRGKSTADGTFVYGMPTFKLLRRTGKLVPAIGSGTFGYSEVVPVEPESVAQLVGYDKYGEEIYEGDILNYQDTFFYRALLAGDAVRVDPDKRLVEPADTVPCRFPDLTLVKEAE